MSFPFYKESKNTIIFYAHASWSLQMLVFVFSLKHLSATGHDLVLLTINKRFL